jgi:hypothetical protein
MKTTAFKIYIMSALLTTGIVGASCNKNFDTYNTNPNTLPVTVPESLLEPAIYSVVSQNITRAHRLSHELMQVHVTTVNSDEIHRYIIRPSESDPMWNAWYLQLTNFKDMYYQADTLDKPAYMAVARIMEAWVFSLITDTYGDVPYFNAIKGKDEQIYQPEFDSQKSIYENLFVKLEEANEILRTTTDVLVAEKDPLYKGDLTKWRKFGNTLYLRLLLRVSAKTDIHAVAKIKEIAETNKANFPMFASNAESAVLRFTTTAPYVSPFNTFRDFDFNGDNGLSYFFINQLNLWEDPRRTVWANEVGVGNWEGVNSGYPPGQIPERLSTYKVALKNEPLLGNIINYAELQFMLAEAALKGYITGSSKTFYETGVTNAITFWNLTVPVGHLTKPAVIWVDAETQAQKLEKIITQKYFTYFYTDFQSWFEHRRTGYPVLPIGPGVQNNGEMPSRLKYPVSVQSLNRANYEAAVEAMGGDDINIKVWWQKP